MSIPFIDLKTQFKEVEAQVRAGIDAVLEHGQYIMGPEVFEFEKAMAEFLGVKHCISCSSGTDALLMPLLAYDVKPGDAILTTPFTFMATAEVICLIGATPIFVDIDPATYNLDPNLLEAAIEQVKREGKYRLRGIIPVDMFGLSADYDPIMEIAARHDLFVIEDGAQSMGAGYKGRPACSFGHVAATSFFPAKPLGCYGDGGAVFTDDDDLAERLISVRIHGKGVDKYDNIRIGINGRLDSIQAAILLPKLGILPKEMELRQQVAAQYAQALTGVKTPAVPEGYTSAWAQYTVESPNREQVLAALKQAGIPAAVYYPRPLHLQTAYEHLGYQSGSMPHSESVARRVFSLPMHPYLKQEEIAEIAKVVNGAA